MGCVRGCRKREAGFSGRTAQRREGRSPILVKNPDISDRVCCQKQESEVKGTKRKHSSPISQKAVQFRRNCLIRTSICRYAVLSPLDRRTASNADRKNKFSKVTKSHSRKVGCESYSLLLLAFFFLVISVLLHLILESQSKPSRSFHIHLDQFCIISIRTRATKIKLR